MLAVVAPVLHLKVLAPLAVSVTELPAHTEVADAVIVMFGESVTVIVCDAVPEQFDPLLPVTLYVVVEVGDTVMLAVVAPVLHLKVLAPLAVSVTELPAHTDVAEAVIVIVGESVTVIVCDAVPEQFDPLLPVTLYVVVEFGET